MGITELLLILKGALDLAGAATTLFHQHTAGQTITEEQANALRAQAKALQQQADKAADEA